MIFFLLACTTQEKQDTAQPNADFPLDVQLSDTQVRLGRVSSSSELFAGIAAEGVIGDYKIYNNQVQFIIQSARESSYYIQSGGGVIDADIVRGAGELGRDIIDEHTVMAGFGRILNPTSFEIVSDGSDGMAHLQVLGEGIPFNLLQGAVENYDLVKAYDMTFQIDYMLPPDSPLLQIAYTVFWEDDSTPIQLANVVLVGKEILHNWNPGSGFQGGGSNEWIGLVSHQDEIALALMPDSEPFATSLLQDVLTGATPSVVAFAAAQIMEEGSAYSTSQFLGVGADISDLTDAWYARNQDSLEQYSGTIVDEDGQAVSGARVQIFDGQEAKTMTQTDDMGYWEVSLPPLEDFHYLASGRGTGIFYDLPAGAGWIGPYTEASLQEEVFQSFSSESEGSTFARGYGVAELDSQVLTAPGKLTVQISDGGPGVLKLYRQNDSTGSENVPSRPHGATQIAYIRDGTIDIPVEPGVYQIYVFRGTRHSVFQQELLIESKVQYQLTADLIAVDIPMTVFSFDSHSHSAPSGDGKVSIEGRLLSHSAHGIDVMVSTEHDHSIDFSPSIAALGLEDHLKNIIGSEVSPPMRGHFNAFPMTVKQEEPNNGSPLWWEGRRDTSELFDLMYGVVEEGGVVQANHPTGSSGLFGSAGYNLSFGEIQNPSYWSPNFVAFELLNDGSYQSVLPYYFDMLSRGMNPTPVGVSDSHSSESGVGVNKTYIFSPSNETGMILEALHNNAVVVSRGPLISATIMDELAFGKTYIGMQEITIQVYSPDWIQVDTVVVYQNGEVLHEVNYTGEELLFSLNPSADAYFVIEVKGETSMSPMYGEKPWAMSSPIYIDMDDDGWTPILAPLSE